jgi:hypothetical protein
MEDIKDRVALLVRMARPKVLSQLGGTNHERWKNIRKGAIRMGTDEIAVLVKMYPQYALWLASGNTAPEVGQTSPEYDKANSNFPIKTRDSDHQNSSFALVFPKNVRRKGLSMNLGNRLNKINRKT